MRSGGAERPRRSPFIWSLFLLPGPRNSDRRERSGLFDRDLPGAAEIEQREEGDGLLDTREVADLLVEVEAGAAAQHGAEAVEELGHGRETQRHMRERDLGRLLREEPDHV